MSAFDRVREMAVSYPESNPFDMHPPLHNLRPESAQDPPVLENTLLEIAQAEGSRGHNLFHRMLGDCPLLFGSTALPPDSPLPDGGELTPLHKISAAKFKFRIVKSLTHHRILKCDAYDGPLVFQIKVGEEMRVLKVYPEPERPPEEEISDVGLTPVERFGKEHSAYTRLSHYAVCARGIVPQCFGWLYLDKKRVERMGLQGRGAYALVLEYLADAQPITSRNITIDIADKALRGLREIHSAYVMHADIASRGNILLLPGGRVVWIDFDFSCCGSYTTRNYLRRELARCWTHFYRTLIPDRVIGLHED